MEKNGPESVFLSIIRGNTKKNASVSCVYQKIVVPLHPKIYVGGVCLFVLGGFSDILNSVY